MKNIILRNLGWIILALSLALVVVPISFSTYAHASTDEQDWQTHYAVNGFVNTGQPDPHQIFKIHYRVINGTIEKFSMPYVEYAHYIKADVSSEGNSTLEIRFPKNYPSSDAGNGELLDAIIFFNELEVVANQVYTDDCFIDFSIPFSGSGTIDVVRTSILTGQPFRGVDVPESCLQDTLVQDIVKTKEGVIPPFHQFDAGVKVDEVVCDIVTHPNGKQYCATPVSAEILKERWNVR